MSSSTRSSSSARKAGVVRVTAGAGAAEQLAALATFKQRDKEIAKSVDRVVKSVDSIKSASQNRHAVAQWVAMAEKLRTEQRQLESEFRDAWRSLDNTLFMQHERRQLSMGALASLSPADGDFGLGWMRRQIKSEGDDLQHMFSPLDGETLLNHPHVIAARACAATKSSPAAALARIASSRQEQLASVEECERQIQQIGCEISSLTAGMSAAASLSMSAASSLSSCSPLVPWFLEQVKSPPLGLVTKDWFSGYGTILRLQPHLFDVLHEHLAQQQEMLDQIAIAAAGTREVLLETAGTRELERLWQLWSGTPALAPGGKSRRERALMSAKQERLIIAPAGLLEDALDLLLELAKQRQQLRSKYSGAAESAMQQMRRLDDVVMALAALQEAEAVHSTFLTEQEQEQQATRARVAQLQAAKEVSDAEAAAEQAAADEAQQIRDAAQRARDDKLLQERQAAVARWLDDKAVRARAAEEQAAAEAQAREEARQEELRAGAIRVQQRQRVDDIKQHLKEQAREQQTELDAQHQQRLDDFFTRTDEKIGVTRDPKRVQAATATSEATASLPTVGESTAQYANTGHGYSNHAIVRDARFRLHEALSMAGLQSTAYGRSVMHAAAARAAAPMLAARSMVTSLNNNANGK